MCGIIGYVGDGDGKKHVLEGLYALEYRGYDSAGVAAIDKNGKLSVVKEKGKIKILDEKLGEFPAMTAFHCGIGHTRWATHGEPNQTNAHPHGSASVQVVHNGIIENYISIKEKLIGEGYKFLSETDTETAALLVDRNYKLTKDYVQAVRLTMEEIEGAYALGVLFADDPETIYAARLGSPLIVGSGEGENYIASDIAALLKYTNKYYQLDDGELAIVKKDKIKIFGKDGNQVQKELNVAEWDIAAAERGGYAHFMLKEINQEPEAVVNTLHPRIRQGMPDFTADGITPELFARVRKIYIVACGTAMYAGLIGRDYFKSLAGIDCAVDIASEFRYRDPMVGKGDIVIIISQSGETADSLAALRLAKQKGAAVLGVVNVVGSSIAREADYILYTRAGLEISVASTKAYTVQAALLALLATYAGCERGKLTAAETREFTDSLINDVPKAIERTIAMSDTIKEAAGFICKADDIFFIGRNRDYSLVMEASLKLKEISYIHAEAYAAGELKHGTISLITEGTPVIAAATVSALYEKMVSNIEEVKARGAKILTIAMHNAEEVAKVSDRVILLPETDERLSIFPAATAFQLLAYYTALARGCDIDQPRNLAKSVTVE